MLSAGFVCFKVKWTFGQFTKHISQHGKMGVTMSFFQRPVQPKNRWTWNPSSGSTLNVMSLLQSTAPVEEPTLTPKLIAFRDSSAGSKVYKKVDTTLPRVVGSLRESHDRVACGKKQQDNQVQKS